MKIWKFFVIFTAVVSNTLNLSQGGTVRYQSENNRLLEYYEASPRSCSLNGQLGKCRFVWDCYKSGGTNLGLCRLDTSMYGSCCSAPEDSWTQLPTTIAEDATSTFINKITNSHLSSNTSTKINATTATVAQVQQTTPFLPPATSSNDIVDYIEEQFIVLPEITLADLSNKTTTTTTPEATTSAEEEMQTTTMQPASRETDNGDDFMFRPSQCGIVHRMSPKQMENYFPAGDGPLKKKLSRIIGGEDATFAAWPWVASVRRSSLFGYSSTHSCGGVLLNENWVATAAHCVAALSKSLIRVRLGEFNFKDDNEEFPFVERRIDKKVVHPNYNFTSYENDLALVKLSSPVEFSVHISPLCLPKNLNDTLVGRNASIVGWGRLSEGGKYSQLLQYVQVPIISNDECVKMFKSAGRMEMIPENFMCAGYKQGGRDGCQGDSGGPLQVLGPENRWFLAGVMSWGIGCGEPNSPGVYTRISKFTEWILQNASV